jgi:fumarylpyruvate hydrolase
MTASDVETLNQIGTIYCVGRNYRAHAMELGNQVPDKPLIFLKNSSSAQWIDQAKVHWNGDLVHYETELVLRIGADKKLGEACRPEDISHIALGLDLTKRQIQDRIKNEGHPWFAAKCFAGSAILAPFIDRPEPSVLDSLFFEMHLNGKLAQKGHAKDMLFKPLEILNYLNQIVSLRKNDLIFTGTPEGVGSLRKGDAVVLKFSNISGSWSGVID